jgi:hypothetical protein
MSQVKLFLIIFTVITVFTGKTSVAAQGGNLVFNPQTRTILDNGQHYASTVRLQNYNGVDLKALQFKIVFNGLLLFKEIKRGADIPAPDWIFSYAVAKGNANPDGSRNDTIKVVLVGFGTNQLPPGADYEIALFEFDVIDINEESLETFIHFEGVIGGTGAPDPGKDAKIIVGASQQITVNNSKTPDENINEEYTLKQNFPNPFNPSTNIIFELPEASNIVISIYNMLGQKITELVNDFTQAGVHTIVFNGNSLSSGTYIYTLESDKIRLNRKFTLIK